jgi:hypothetical protein
MALKPALNAYRFKKKLHIRGLGTSIQNNINNSSKEE